MTMKEFFDTDLYKQTATQQTKAFISSFITYCLYFMIFTTHNIGLWWILIIFIGIIASSFCFALPYTLLIVKRMLSRMEYINRTEKALTAEIMQREIKNSHSFNFILSIIFFILQFTVLYLVINLFF